MRSKQLEHLVQLFRFALVSGTGLTLDLILFLGLCSLGLRPFLANAIASATGVTFVYFASVRRVFRYEGRFLTAMFGTYALYQALGTVLVSWVVSTLILHGLHPVIVKAGILPATFCANYLFMRWLTSRPERWVSVTRS
jgi:putative flippase GtrA